MTWIASFASGSNVSTDFSPLAALGDIAAVLTRLGRPFALVGGLAVSIRAEVRFTRDVDIALAVSSDSEVEQLVHTLQGEGYRVLALVEHEARGRVATVRLGADGRSAGRILKARSGGAGWQRRPTAPCYGA